MKSINEKISLSKHKSEISKEQEKILINETSVYKEYTILKENALTSQNYFDLVQIPNLRVYAGEFLKILRLQSNLTQLDFSRKYNISKLALYQWEHDRAAMPLVELVKLAKDYGFDKEKIYQSIKSKYIQLKKDLNLSFRYEDFILF